MILSQLMDSISDSVVPKWLANELRDNWRNIRDRLANGETVKLYGPNELTIVISAEVSNLRPKVQAGEGSTS